MAFVLKLECIGDDAAAAARAGVKSGASWRRYVEMMKAARNRAWVAIVTEFDVNKVYGRKFLDGLKDYSQANRVGSRGVYKYYALKSGIIYEISSPTKKGAERYLAVVDGDVLKRMTNEEALRWLESEA